MHTMARAIQTVKGQRREAPAGAGDPQHIATTYRSRADYKCNRAAAQAIEDEIPKYNELSRGEKMATPAESAEQRPL